MSRIKEYAAIAARETRGDKPISPNEAVSIFAYINSELDAHIEQQTKSTYRPESLEIARSVLDGTGSGMSVKQASKEVTDFAIDVEDEDPKVRAVAAQRGLLRRSYY